MAGAVMFPPAGSAGSGSSGGDSSGGAGSGVGGGGVSGGGTPDGPERPSRSSSWAGILASVVAAVRRDEHNVVPYTYWLQAEQAAQERRDAVIQAGELPYRFAETPPGLYEGALGDPWIRPLLQGDQEQGDWYIEQARLTQQRADDALLLLARATDAVIAIVRVISSNEQKTPEAVWKEMTPSVWLLPIPRLRQRSEPRLFPWRVRITAERHDVLEPWFRGQGRWLGIGVDLAHGRGSIPQAACRAVGGGRGSVGGYIEDSNGNAWATTCAHVLGDACVSKRLRGDYSNDFREPDFALLQRGSCLNTDSVWGPEVRAVTVDEAKKLVGTKDDIVCRIVGNKSPTGRIVMIGNCVTHDGRRTDVWTMAIRRRRLVRLFIPKPLVRPRFSHPGDSGSWVFDQARSSWFGMIIGADRSYSFAHMAEALFDYAAARRKECAATPPFRAMRLDDHVNDSR